MSTVSSAEPSYRIDLGQRLFLFGVFSIVVAETMTTVVNIGEWFEWTSCLLGVVATLVILYLGNWLYSGDKTAHLATTIWVIFFVGLTLLAIFFRLEFESTGAAAGERWSRHLGVNVLWEGFLKLAAYCLFAVILFAGPTRDWLAIRRGEPAPTLADAVPALSGEPVELAAEHTNALAACAAAMTTASITLIGIGLVECVVAFSFPAFFGGYWPVSIVEGFALLGLGLGLTEPAKKINDLLAAAPKTTGYVATFLQTLESNYARGLILTVLSLGSIAILRVAWKVM
jgi:hypothetical protein